MRKVLCLFIIMGFGALSLGAAEAPTRPPSPEGYEWRDCEGTAGQFLVPEGWFFKEEASKGTVACFITKEEISPPSGFETGITVNQLKDIPGRLGISPLDYAQLMADGFSDESEVLERSQSEQGPFSALRLEVIDAKPPEAPLHLWVLFVANPKTGTLNFVLFESPETEWSENWRVVEPNLGALGFDDEQ